MAGSTPPPVPPGPEVPGQAAGTPQPQTPSPAYPNYPQFPLGPPLSVYSATNPDPRYLPEPSRTMAGWALGLAIVPCLFPVASLVAIGLAIAVLAKGRDGRNHGKGRAIAALIIAPLWIVVIVVGAVVGAFGDLTADAERDPSGRVTASGEVSTFKIRQGDCLDYPELTALDPTDENEQAVAPTVTIIPCPQPHDFEAYFAYDVAGDDYPGEDAVSKVAATKCFARFKAFVGVPYGKSELEPYYLYPTSRSWRFLDDHAVTCLVGEPGKKTSSTLAGSRR